MEKGGLTTKDPTQLRRLLQERTADLQRVKAEYDNYRRRVRRDRVAVREIAVANVLRALLPVLDAVDRACAHEPMTPGLRTSPTPSGSSWGRWVWRHSGRRARSSTPPATRARSITSPSVPTG